MAGPRPGQPPPQRRQLPVTPGQLARAGRRVSHTAILPRQASTVQAVAAQVRWRSESKKGNRYLAAITGETAAAAGKTQTREGARYRRLARRRGKAKAQVAVGNTQLKVLHKLLSNPGMCYQDLGPDYYERRADARRQIAHHVGKLSALGFEVTLARLPDPEPDGTDPAQAA